GEGARARARLSEPSRRTRVEIEDDLTGAVRAIDAPRMGMELDRAEVGEPGQRRRLLDDAVPERLPAPPAHIERADPWRPTSALRLEPTGSIDAFGEPPQHRRASAQVGKKGRSDRQEIGDEIALRRPGRWPEHASRMGDPYVAAADIEFEWLLRRRPRMGGPDHAVGTDRLTSATGDRRGRLIWSSKQLDATLSGLQRRNLAGCRNRSPSTWSKPTSTTRS